MKKRLLGFSIALSCLAFAGCEDDSTWLVKTTDGPMEISRIVNPKTYEEISSAALDQLILVQGVNLNNVATIFINDVEAEKPTDMIPVNGSILVRVPYIVPTEIDNKIKLTDKQGRSVEAPLEVTVPELVIEGMSCEYAPAGSTLVISGNYFDLYGMTPDDGVVLFGDIETPIVAANKTSVTVQVPGNVPANTTLTLKSDIKTATCPGKYKDDEYILQTFEGNTWNDTYKIAYVSGPNDPDHGEADDPAGISGKYMRYHNTYVGGWNWQGFDWPVINNRPADLATNAANYALKFECYAVKTLADPILFIAPMINNAQSGYRWGEDDSFPMGEWRTYTIPLTETVGDINTWVEAAQAQFVFHAAGTGKESYWCIDNVRISKIK